MLRGSTDILNTVCSHLGGNKPGETTKDGKFTVIEVECQGACSNAPMMVIGDDFYEYLTEESTVKILDAFAKGQKPKPGPQSGRKTSENSAGLTALTSKVCIALSYSRKSTPDMLSSLMVLENIAHQSSHSRNAIVVLSLT